MTLSFGRDFALAPTSWCLSWCRLVIGWNWLVAADESKLYLWFCRKIKNSYILQKISMNRCNIKDFSFLLRGFQQLPPLSIPPTCRPPPRCHIHTH